jgi:hypothetical protein
MASIAETLRNDMRTQIQIERKRGWEYKIVELNEQLSIITNPKWRLEILTELKEAYVSLASVIEVEILSEKAPTNEWDKVPAIGTTEFNDMCMNMFGGNPTKK